MLMGIKAADQIPDIADIFSAQQRIGDKIRTTPVVSDPQLNAEIGCELWLKCENLQHTGAFKFRGASNAVAILEEQGKHGDVATHSSGNHGAALALAASTNNRRAWVVMPENSIKPKVEAVHRNGGEIVFCAPNQQEREKGLAALVAKGCIPVPPYDHGHIISGQGTVVIEMSEQIPGLDIIITPVGGGGLISGAAIAARALIPGVNIIGAEPEGAADTALSLSQGRRVDQFAVDTIADGLRAIVGILNFEIIHNTVDEVITVSDEQIIEAMALIWQRFRMLVEPSSATVLAAILASPGRFSGQRVGAVISGGNVDLEHLPFTP
ncbi:MAG: pyridoxal-phosphate dependent enzyme [Xanthomonadales bacterium]|jgi:threonine dehydratase|nr:pyridoxal-phosphate dependent enzyme [Xanthomonadales bacterium]MDH4019919.1 pyridoxal-phosphate dependent enzyme [Xanthomonadales bacterium]